MCKEINKLIKIIFVCIVHPRQRFPYQGQNKCWDGVRCHREALLMLSGTRRSSRGPWCGDADLIFNAVLVFSSFVSGGTRSAVVQLVVAGGTTCQLGVQSDVTGDVWAGAGGFYGPCVAVAAAS